jgi:antitoxin VapB
MPLSIKNAEAEQLARELARETHESITTAITRALEERLIRVRGSRLADDRRRRALDIIAQCAALPDLDTRNPEEILGYDDQGVFK